MGFRLRMLSCIVLTGLVTDRPASADSEADALFRQIVEAHRSVRALRASIAITGVTGSNKTKLGFTGSCSLQKPDSWRFQVKGGLDTPRGKPQEYVLVSDGTISWKVSVNAHRFVKDTTRKNGFLIAPMDPLSRFFFADSPSNLGDGRAAETRLLPAARIGGVTCRSVELSSSGIDTGRKLQLYVGPDLLVRRVRESTFSHGEDVIEITLSNLRAGAPLPRSEFVYDPSPEMQESRNPVQRDTWFTGFLMDESADEAHDAGPLKDDWRRLPGIWAGPPWKTPSGQQSRYILRLRGRGSDWLFEQFEETQGADGKKHTGIIHSATLVVAEVREKDRHKYLVVRPKGSRPGQYDWEVEYAFVNVRLTLTGHIGSARLDGVWSRLPDGYGLR